MSLLLQVITIIAVLTSPVSLFYEAQSPAMAVSHDVGFDYDKFPMLNFTGSPEGFTLLDVTAVIFSSITFTVESLTFNSIASNESFLVTFTRWLDGEPYLSYYGHPNITVNYTAVLDWYLPFDVARAGSEVAIEVPNFELSVQISLSEGYEANISVVTNWEIQWVKQHESISVTTIAVLLFSVSMAVATLAYVLYNHHVTGRWKP